MADDHAERIGPVQHLGVAQLREGRGFDLLDALPQAELAQGVGGAVRQGNFTAVKGGFGDGLLRLLLQYADAQALAGKCARQNQSGRAGSHNQNVVMHGEAV